MALLLYLFLNKFPFFKKNENLFPISYFACLKEIFSFKKKNDDESSFLKLFIPKNNRTFPNKKKKKNVFSQKFPKKYN